MKPEVTYISPTVKRLEEVESAEFGMPATYSIGSDSYAYMVVGVQRFKSGARQGKVRAIYAQDAKYVDGVLVSQEGPIERFIVNKFGYVKREGMYGTLFVGYARDYRDPGF
jgi:hypothetical protein